MLDEIDFTKPIQIPDEWVAWEGKELGAPKPPIIWYGSGSEHEDGRAK